MKTTKVIQLNTKEDVERFCKTILRLKNQAPKSLLLTVAVTAEQDVAVEVPVNMVSNGWCVETELCKLDGSKPTVRPVQVRQPQPKVLATRPTRPPTRPRRTARPVLKSIL